MRCYLMRGGHIVGVEVLEEVAADRELIEQAKAVFASLDDERLDGFELWDGARVVYRHPACEAAD